MKRGRSLAPLDGTVSRSLRGRAPLSRVAPTGSYQVRPQLSNFGACAASGGFPVPLVTPSAQELSLLQVAGEPSLGSQHRGRSDLQELRALCRGSMAGARAVLDDDKTQGGRYLGLAAGLLRHHFAPCPVAEKARCRRFGSESCGRGCHLPSPRADGPGCGGGLTGEWLQVCGLVFGRAAAWAY